LARKSVLRYCVIPIDKMIRINKSTYTKTPKSVEVYNQTSSNYYQSINPYIYEYEVIPD